MTSPQTEPRHSWSSPRLKSLILLLLLLSSALFSQQIPPKPKLQTALYDWADLLNPQQERALKQKLIAYGDSTSTQLVILTMKSIGQDDINLFAAELAQKWGIGQKGKDNGILILVDKSHRKVAIQNGYGIEYLLTDALSRELIETDIVPNFKRNRFYEGLDLAVDNIFKILKGTYKADPRKRDTSGGSPFLSIFFILVLFIVIFYLLSKGRGGGGKGRGGRRDVNAGGLLLTGILLSGMGRGFGSGGGFGGGGLGSGGFGGGFGGGGFGGGGASGGW